MSSHLKCALIETQPLQKQKSWDLPPSQYSNRASSITPTNESFLEKIGAWRHLDLRRVQPYSEMQVWDAANDASIQFDWQAEAVKYNAPLRTVATMTENANLSRALLRRVEELGSDSSLFPSTSVERIENGVDDPEGINMSSWPILSLKPSTTDPSSTAKQIAARLLIGADGINSPVRTFAGINTNGWDYNRHGVVATLELEPTQKMPTSSEFDQALDDFLSEDSDIKSQDSHPQENITPANNATAYQRFIPALGGPIAILPLPNNHASLVWSTTPQIATYLKSLSPSAFVATVNAALRLDQVDIKYMLTLPPTSLSESDSSTSKTQYSHDDELRWRLSQTNPPPVVRPPPLVRGVQAGTVASFPLRLRNASAYTAPRIALAGDAAHTIHPLAGQGLNLGLGDAAALASTIEYAVEHGMDLGDLGVLEKYSSQRYGKAVVMGSGVDALNWMYQLGGSGDGIVSSLLGRARGLGMQVVQSGWIPGLKETIMRRAD